MRAAAAVFLPADCHAVMVVNVIINDSIKGQ